MSKLTRKEFLQLSLTSTVAFPVMGYGRTTKRSNTGPASQPDMAGGVFYENLGFQVYTLRDLLVDNAASLFSELAKAGIKNIEFYDPITLDNYVPIVKEYGMNPLATHCASGYVTGIWERGQEPEAGYGFDHVVEDCLNNGVKYLGVAILTGEERGSMDACKRFAEMANVCGEKSRAAGIQLFYHNHNFEFTPMYGTTPFQEMINIFDRELVKLELDVFWAAVAGQDPVEWIGRIAPWMLFLHLKDLKRGTQLPRYTTDLPADSFIELGEGMVQLEQILIAGKNAGITTAIIDQDETRMADKVASVNKNTAYIKKLGI